ncbi:S41 family peptidase [Silvanigrella aquatica]|uniref:Tail specific protease domain-containing protein n=1 Tax=Silvanigrella aquatica TaxID=1915309 RepID=A0A1L4CZ68_9BACT|nr:S41 family peptidase [Silvanigrella aquatica]APJ03230.1 hypothetical protein AXG55_04650 [Silvanigrella aquatica]
MKRAIQSGDKFIKSLPITEKETLDKSPKNLFPKSENKKVIILTNAACYSACDAFVALMKDQNLTTKIIGEQKYTGGGGANVLNWNKMQKHKVFDYEFENSMDMNFSWRAMQSRLPDGTYRTIEGKGTEVDCVIPKTVDDIKFSNPADIVKNRTYVERILQNIDNDTLCVNK